MIIPMAFVLSFVWKIRGVWCAFPATEALVAVIAFLLFLSAQKMYKNNGSIPIK